MFLVSVETLWRPPIAFYPLTPFVDFNMGGTSKKNPKAKPTKLTEFFENPTS